MKPNVHLTIDRLVLHGFERVHRARLHAAVTDELARLLAEADLLQMRDVPAVKAGTIRAASNMPAEKLGEQIARAIYGGLNQ